MVRADQARKVEPGDRGVTVGILDTGLDASHPDLAPNFSARLSRNFAPDIADDRRAVRGRELPRPGRHRRRRPRHARRRHDRRRRQRRRRLRRRARRSRWSSSRAARTPGFFFLEPVVNALTYAGDAGIDVVNMSFYVDPWLYNCTDNPADSPEAQAEQRTIIAGMTPRADLRPPPRRHAGRRARQQARGPGQAAYRTSTARTTRRTRVPAADRQRHLLRPADRGPVRDRRLGARPVRQEVRLLQLRHRADLGLRAGRLVPRRLRHATRTAPTATMILSTYPMKVLQEEGSVDADGNVVPAARARSSRTARPPAPAATTRTCRAPRWRRRTPPASRR